MSKKRKSGHGARQGGGGDQGRGGAGQEGTGQGGKVHGEMAQSHAGQVGMGGAPGMHQAPYMPQFAAQYPPQQAWSGHAAPPLPGFPSGMGSMAGQAGPPQGMAQVMQEIANGGNGLSSLSKLLDFDDKDFWKGALVGAAAVLLLTNETVHRALFRGAVKGRDAVKEGVEKVRQGVDKVKQSVGETAEKSDD